MLGAEKNSQGYVRNRVDGDGNCGYTAFSITREQAVKLLLENIESISDLIRIPVGGALLTEAFYNDLLNNNIIRVPYDTIINADEEHLRRYTGDLAIQSVYIQYDVMDQKIDAGYCHPAVLQALAHIQHIELHMWRLGESDVLIPHRVGDEDYASYIPAGGYAERRLDILFVNGNHFDLLEIIGYQYGNIPTSGIYPLDQPLQKTEEVKEQKILLVEPSTSSYTGEFTLFQCQSGSINNKITLRDFKEGGKYFYIVQVDKMLIEKLNVIEMQSFQEKMLEYFEMVVCLYEKTEYVTINHKEIISKLIFSNHDVAKELRTTLVKMCEPVNTPTKFVEQVIGESKHIDVAQDLWQQNEIDIEKTLTHWGNILIKECNPSSKLEKIFFQDEINNFSKTDKKNIMQRIKNEIGKNVSPVIKISLKNYKILGFSESIKTREIKLFDENFPDMTGILIKDNNASFNCNIEKKENITINNVLRINKPYSFTIEIPKLKKINLSITNDESTSSRNVKINLEVPIEKDKDCVVLEDIVTEYDIMAEIEITGYVILKSKEKKINPGKNHTRSGEAHFEWIIPINKVFQDLKQYLKDKKLPEELNPIINLFNINSNKNSVSYSVLCKYNFINDKNTRLRCSFFKEHKDKFVKYFNCNKEYLRNYYMKKLQLKRIFYPPLPLQSYYIDLFLEYKNNIVDINFIDNFLAKNTSSTINQRKSHVLIFGEAGIGKTTLAMYTLQQWSMGSWGKEWDWVFFLSFRNINKERYPEKKHPIEEKYILAEIIINECFTKNIFPFVDQLKQSKFFIKHLDELLKEGKILIILDGLDEQQNIPDHLDFTVKEIFSLQRLICLSRRSYFGKYYEFDKNSIVTVIGFNPNSNDSAFKYINNFFESIQNSRKDNANKLKNYLEKNNNNSLSDIYHSPVNCEMICTAWDRGFQHIENITNLYNKIIIPMVLIRYLEKFPNKNLKNINIKEATNKKLLNYCKIELNSLEFLGFIACLDGNIRCSTEHLNHYMKNKSSEPIGSIFENLAKIGFIKDESSIYSSPIYSFIHIMFRDFFAARYLLNCLNNVTGELQKKPYPDLWIGSDEIQKIMSSEYHGNTAKDFVEFIIKDENKLFLFKFNGCFEFFSILLGNDKANRMAKRIEQSLRDLKEKYHLLVKPSQDNISIKNKIRDTINPLVIEKDELSLSSGLIVKGLFDPKNVQDKLSEKNSIDSTTIVSRVK